MRVQPAYLRGSHHIYLKGRQPGDLLTCDSGEKHRCNSVAEVMAGMNSIQARRFEVLMAHGLAQSRSLQLKLVKKKSLWHPYTKKSVITFHYFEV